MIFRFLKYIQPTHYFALRRNNGYSPYPIAKHLPKEVIDKLSVDTHYQSATATAYDLSWQALLKGYIGETETYQHFEKLPVADEYRFLRKNFHPVWALYVWLIRMFTFKNPFTETSAFLKTKGTQRIPYAKASLTYPNWNTETSSLLASQPLVSVVIPTLNRYDYLKEVLADFEKQTYTNFEIIVVDQSVPFKPAFYDAFALNIKLVRQEEPALWLARNTAVQAANGKFIALSEDDVRVPATWLENHLRCLDYFKADISAGVFYPEGAQIPENRSYFTVASQFATGNALLYKNVFKKAGLFDRQFERQRMGDGEFGLRCYVKNFKSVSNPFAYCLDVKAPVGGLRQMGSWDAFRPKKWFSPRPIPSVLYLYRRYYGNKRTFLALLKSIPPSIIPYRFKKNRKLLLLGIFVSIFLMPIIGLQVFISWQKASKKMHQGPLIATLD